MLGRAIDELGRIFKTRYLLLYLNDENYRRKILNQLNRGEARHSLARAVFYGKRGELRQPYREGQEDQLGALGLVVNTIVVWNTRYIEAALQVLRNRGHMINNDDISRLSPLGHKHINIVGRYSLVLPEKVKDGQLRTLIYKETNQIKRNLILYKNRFLMSANVCCVILFHCYTYPILKCFTIENVVILH